MSHLETYIIPSCTIVFTIHSIITNGLHQTSNTVITHMTSHYQTNFAGELSYNSSKLTLLAHFHQIKIVYNFFVYVVFLPFSSFDQSIVLHIRYNKTKPTKQTACAKWWIIFQYTYNTILWWNWINFITKWFGIYKINCWFCNSICSIISKNYSNKWNISYSTRMSHSLHNQWIW